MTLFGALREAAGLSLQEAADFHGVRLDTIKSWTSGRRRAPPDAINKFRALLASQEVESLKLAPEVSNLSAEALAAMLTSDTTADAAIGWPSASVYNTILCRSWARGKVSENR